MDVKQSKGVSAVVWVSVCQCLLLVKVSFRVQLLSVRLYMYSFREPILCNA